MKPKILFLSFNFPFGQFGPSTNCMSRIMEALSESGVYDIYNLSYSGKINNYREIKGVKIKIIPQQPPKYVGSRMGMFLRFFFHVLFYPFSNYFFCRKVYKKSKKALFNAQFDLVIAQCNTEESVWAGTWLKQSGIGNKLMVIFWDNIYGNQSHEKIPSWFAKRRQWKAEEFIAKNADILVSLYPIKSFHEKYGDIPEAYSKRVYLGVPSIIKPKQLPESSYKNVICPGMINILYSGTVFSIRYVKYVVNLINKIECSERVNLIFFARGVDLNEIIGLGKDFKGQIKASDWIPLNELLSIYPSVDFFMSYPGIITAIRSKVFEYMSYGKPILLFYDNDNDVNIHTFSKYPVYKAIDIRRPVDDYVVEIESFLDLYRNTNVPFEVTEQLFPKDSVKAYVELISNLIDEEQ